MSAIDQTRSGRASLARPVASSGAGGTWGAPQTLVPSELGKNRYYPAIAPDGNLLVYDESTCTNGTPTAGQPADKSCDADTDATATIMFTSLQGNAPIPLTNANAPGVADNGATALTDSGTRALVCPWRFCLMTYVHCTSPKSSE